MFEAEKRQDSVFAVYYLALHVWQVFGHSAIVLRSLSVLFALGAIPLVFVLARRLFGTAVAVTAAFVLALNVAYLYYATEARPYGIVFFFAACAMYLFVCMAYDGRYRLAPWYAAVSVVALYLHPLAILLPVAHGLSLLVVRSARAMVMVFAACFAAITVVAVPMFWLAARDGTAQIAWIPGLSRATLGAFAENLAGTAPLAVVLGALVVVAVWNGRSDASRRTAALFVWAVVPIVLGAAISVVQHVFIARYFLYTLIPVVILAAYGLLALRNSVARVVAVIAVTAVIGQGLWYLAGYQVEDWRGAVAFIEARALRGDARLVYVPFQTVPYHYAYAELTGRDDTAVVYPTEMLGGGSRTAPLPASVVQTFAHRRVWVVFSRAHAIEQTPLRAVYRYAHPGLQRAFTGVEVFLFEPGEAPR